MGKKELWEKNLWKCTIYNKLSGNIIQSELNIEDIQENNKDSQIQVIIFGISKKNGLEVINSNHVGQFDYFLRGIKKYEIFNKITFE